MSNREIDISEPRDIQVGDDNLKLYMWKIGDILTKP